jgi:hypothetical protein
MILLEHENWIGSRTAVLEQGNDAIYLYSWPNDDQGQGKSVWVANSKKRIRNRSSIEKDMNKGAQPYLPRKLCNANGYIVDYADAGQWELQWGLDQNSIAVRYRNRIVAILPEWSGFKGFHGYSVGTDDETSVAWPLLDGNVQFERFDREKAFLADWSDSMWVNHQEAMLGLYEGCLPGESRYFAADGGRWPPLGINYLLSGDMHFFGTVGLSQLPMPSFGMNYDDDVVDDYRRIELAIVVENASEMEPLARYLSGQAMYPWTRGSHFDRGHTIPCRELGAVGSEMSFMAFWDEAAFLPELDTPDFMDKKTRLLFMIPIYDTEQAFAEQNTTSQLIERLTKLEHPLDLKRERVV